MKKDKIQRWGPICSMYSLEDIIFQKNIRGKKKKDLEESAGKELMEIGKQNPDGLYEIIDLEEEEEPDFPEGSINSKNLTN